MELSPGGEAVIPVILSWSSRNAWAGQPAWHLHLALSGSRFDATEKSMAFGPQINPSEFTCFWSTNKGWGRAFISANSIELEVLFGELDIDRITLPAVYGYRHVDEISHGKASVNRDGEAINISLTGSRPLYSGMRLSMKFRS